MSWFEKLASPKTDGHWRKLDASGEGHDQAGNPVKGRTWVRRNRMRSDAGKPYAHQKEFVRFVRKMPDDGGIIAAHGTGTGKTRSAIEAFEVLKGQGRARRALVITPAGLRDNFVEKGVERFTDSRAEILARPRTMPDDVEYVVTSYDSFRRNPGKWVRTIKPDTIIADEIHRAANPQSRNYRAMRQARQEVPRFIGMTASVVQNKPDDVVPLLQLASGGENPIRTQRGFRKAHVQKSVSSVRGIFGGTTYDERLVRTALLKSSLGGTIHYVEDLDSSKKPAKDVISIDVPMSDEQLDLYRMAMRGVDPVVLKHVQEGKPITRKEANNVFLRMMRARQVSNSLQLATPHMTLEEAAERTPKIRKLLEDAEYHMKAHDDAQIIMYTNFVHGGVDVLEAGLKKRGIPYGIFAGRGVKGVTEETRQAAVNDYLDGKNKVIIITGAGAEGLSLGNTTLVQLVDGHYNPERIAQAEARGVRAGGLSHRPPKERRVEVRRYVSSIPKTFWQKVTFKPPERSVDQWVYLTAGKKQRLNRQVRDTLTARTQADRERARPGILERLFSR